MSDRGVVEGAAARAKHLLDFGGSREDAEVIAGDVLALLRENRQLRETLRLREESQIPMIPHGAQEQIAALVADREALLEHIRQLEKQLLGGNKVARSGGGS